MQFGALPWNIVCEISAWIASGSIYSAMGRTIERASESPVIAVIALSRMDIMAEHSGLPEALPADISKALSQLR
jgi:hypothetical protein